MRVGRARQECPCGSGLERRERQARATYRPEIFDDPDYWTDEPVDNGEDDGWDGEYGDGESVL